MIGRRLRELRAVRGQTLREVAQLAGLHHSYLGRIERGERPVERRSTLERLAAALRVAPGELTGQPLPPATPVAADGHGAVHALRGVLRDIDTDMLAERPTEAWDAAQLRRDVTRAAALNADCDFAAVGAIIPELLARAYLNARSGEPEAQRLLIGALLPAFYLAKDLGFHDVGWSLAQLLHAAACTLDDPAWVGVAQFLRAEAMTGDHSRQRALTLAVRAADEVKPDDGPRGEAFGLLRLSAALQSAVTGAERDVDGLLGEAREVAERTGAGNFAGMHFGPLNVSIWQVALSVELGDADRVPELARNVQVDAIPSAGRKASFFMDLGRGLAARRGRDTAAVEALQRAETLAPQLVHANPYVRETVTDMFLRARRDAGSPALRGLAYRLGVGA